MNEVNKTLYIPLYGKAYTSKKGVIIHDKKAEDIWAQTTFPLTGKAKSKWLAYYMSMRAVVFDKWLQKKKTQFPEYTVLHLGCGLDSRIDRVGTSFAPWYEIDFPAVIEERTRYYTETQTYGMISADIRKDAFLQGLTKTSGVIVVMEGSSMYLTPDELTRLLINVQAHFSNVCMLMDCYTPFACKMSKIRNPVNEVGINTVYGIPSPTLLEETTGLTFVKEHEITPAHLINELHGLERWIFKSVYAGSLSKKLYKLYEYKR